MININSLAHGIHQPVLISFPLCLNMLLHFRNHPVPLAPLWTLKMYNSVSCHTEVQWLLTHPVQMWMKYICPLAATSQMSRYHSAPLHTYEHYWPTYARFRPSNRRIIEGMICAAHSLTATGRAVEGFRSVQRPSTHSFLSCRLNTNNRFELSTPSVPINRYSASQLQS